MTTAIKPARKPREKSILTEKRQKFVDHVLDGKTNAQAAKAAGYSPPMASALPKIQEVKNSIEQGREELQDVLQIKRADVIAGFADAIELARIAAEPATMIAGWREIGKMLGLYEPEVKRVELTAGQAAIRSKLEIMSDDELLAIAEGTLTIEGESSRV